jgi:Na+-driven multidrug efflux pump
MDKGLEARLKKTALISGLVLKAGVGCFAAAGGCALIQKEYADAAKHVSTSFSLSLASYLLLGYAGVSYGKDMVNYFKKKGKKPDQNL